MSLFYFLLFIFYVKVALWPISCVVKVLAAKMFMAKITAKVPRTKQPILSSYSKPLHLHKSNCVLVVVFCVKQNTETIAYFLNVPGCLLNVE